MKILERIIFWTKLAQQSMENKQLPTVATIIHITQIPTFKVNLFSIKPEFSQDIIDIVNIINRYMFNLSGGKVSFVDTWQNPSINSSQFSNSLKNLYSLSKLLYSKISISRQPYSLIELKNIGQELVDMMNGMSFPEPQASNVKSEIISAVQMLNNKLGN